MNKVVVVPQDAKVVYAENSNVAAAGVMVKVCAFMLKRLYRLMGEQPARCALDSLTAGIPESVPVEAVTAEAGAAESPAGVPAIEAPADVPAEIPAAEELPKEKAQKAFNKVTEKKTKAPAKRVLRPTAPEKDGV